MPAAIEKMAYVGKTPWHGLGVRLDKNSDIETWKIEAGLDWLALEKPVNYTYNDIVFNDPSRKVIFRSDMPHKVLSVMRKGYQIVQPGQLLEFYRDLVEQQGFQLETAGSLFDGQKIWALAKTGEGFTLPGKDYIEQYLLLATSMDGTLATTGQWTSVRVVCNNTLSVSMKNHERLKISHKTKFKPEAMKEMLGLEKAKTAWGNFSELAKELAKRKVNQAEALDFVLDVFVDKKDQEAQEKALRSSRINDLWNSITCSPGSSMSSADGTAWGLLNGATHYIDYITGRGVDIRLQSAWFGQNENKKAKAMQHLADLVGWDLENPAKGGSKQVSTEVSENFFDDLRVDN